MPQRTKHRVTINLYKFPKKTNKILKRSVRETLAVKKCALAGEINLILVSDKIIKRLNRKYRKVNKVTDVISFNFNENAFNKICGDIYISKERSKKQARLQNHSWEKEISYLAIHGVLHLFGYTDYTKESRREMFLVQDKIWKHLYSSVQ